MKQLNLFLGLLGGAVIGVGATLLLAPESGKDMRKTIKKNYKDINKQAQKEMKILRKEFDKLNKTSKKDVEELTKKITELGKKVFQK